MTATQIVPRKRIKRDWWQQGEKKWRAKWWTPDRYWVLLTGLENGLTNEQIATKLGTTAVAVNLARKRAGISTHVPDVMNARTVAQKLGILCAKTVSRWIEEGWLNAHRGRAVGANFRWHITTEALQSFLADPDHWHRWEVDRITDPELRDFAESLNRPRYLTPGEVAYRCFVHHSAVNNWIHEGILPAVRHGNWLVAETALDGFIPPGQRERTAATMRRYSAFEDHLIRTGRRDGASFTEIANQLGRTVSSVHARWHRLAVPS